MRIFLKIYLFTSIFFAVFLLGSCGIEDYAVIYAVDDDAFSRDVTYSSVTLTTANVGTAFSHFAIFYRIYLSSYQAITPELERSSIHSQLNSDYNYFNNYIKSDSYIGANMETVFVTNRNYQYLALDGAVIDNVLSSSVLGRQLSFDFPSRDRFPRMWVDSNDYILFRSRLVVDPRPDRNLVNSSDLRTLDNNTDILKPSSGSDSTYAYIAMYIVAVGIDDNYSYFYSTPAFINIFELPNESGSMD